MGEGRGLVLVVEDERTIAELQRLYLTEAGYGVHVEQDGRSALAAVRRLNPVAIILDVGLPGMGGIELCRTLRENGDWTPIVFVTARDDEVDRILGLEYGADDYITKPFSPRELVARLRSVLRRHAGPGAGSPLRSGEVTLWPDQRRVEVSGGSVSLTAMEFDLLAELMRAPGRVFSRESLMSTVWGHGDYAGGRTVDVHIAQLRAKLAPANPIVTFRGAGYSVEA